MTTNFSTIYYKDLNNKAQSLTLPTIQTINVIDNSTISSKPTVTGQYRNQYVQKAAKQVSLVTWLEGGIYSGEILDVSDTLDVLHYIYDNDIRFNLITTHTNEESRFFTNLSIQNINSSREAAHRNRLVYTISCMQVVLTDITWQLASAIEIFGHNIFTNSDAGTSTFNTDFIVGNTNQDFELSDGLVTTLMNKVTDLSGSTKTKVNRQIRDAIKNKVSLSEKSAYFKLSDPIDLSLGSRTINCKCQFKSKYGADSSKDAYTVDLGTFVVNTTEKDVSLEQNYVYASIIGSDSGYNDLGDVGAIYTANNEDIPGARYPYDTADTYSDYKASKSFDYIEGLDTLAEWLSGKKASNSFTTDTKAVSTGSVVVKDGWVWTYKISNHYSYNVTYNDFNKSNIIPDGGLTVNTFNIPKSSVKVTTSDESVQSYWNELNTGVSLVVISLGAVVQLYLFSNSLFNVDYINNSS